MKSFKYYLKKKKHLKRFLAGRPQGTVPPLTVIGKVEGSAMAMTHIEREKKQCRETKQETKGKGLQRTQRQRGGCTTSDNHCDCKY